METSITFYRGIDTIGGIIFEVSYGKESFICDYGKPMNHPLVSADIDLAVDDLKSIGFIPKIDSLEDKDKIVAVGISHLHLDHMGLINYLPNDVPIYMSEPSKKLYEQLIYINEEVGSHIKNTCGIAHHSKVNVTPNIQVTFIPVNHDVIGASSIVIDTPNGRIVFSGDIRFNREDSDTRKWMREVKGCDYLIMESTGFFEDQDYDESEVLVENIDTSQLLDGILDLDYELFIFNVYHRDINRLKYLVNVAREKGMPIVFEKSTARLIENYLTTEEKENVYYYDTRSQNTPRTIQKIGFDVLRGAGAFESGGRESGGRFKGFVQNSFANIAELRKLNLESACYLHLNGMPLGPFDPNYEVLLNWLDYYGLEIVHKGSSGHAEAGQLKHILREINPKVFTAVHGFNPHRLDGDNHFKPEYGVRYTFDEVMNFDVE